MEAVAGTQIGRQSALEIIGHNGPITKIRTAKLVRSQRRKTRQNLRRMPRPVASQQ